ncbi:DUF2865 domain-containing protein [Methylobacterium iners]|uniref:DUF2865 domain-containing protein n=1 Tax=Methylobacterium iners TaxID=418707 RepID=A0ABQ4RWL2_9HYPH|nr:DUF2865 domain-containing protein [Methylobacterium iners]GJD94582.1 hypothetical protein OCOJLMKI_1785 [Methylobacterium iners]
MVWTRLVPSRARRQMIATALAGLALGLGGVTAGTSLVQASERGGLLGFFEELFRGPPPAAPQPRIQAQQPRRYASLPDARRIAAPRTASYTPRPRVELASEARPRLRRPSRASSAPASAALATTALGARTVCVRACDGYLFPLGQLRSRKDLPVHEAACAAACPNTPTALFTLAGNQSDLDRAVGLDGKPYRSLPSANLFRTTRVAHCGCQPEGGVLPPLPLARDLTLRTGDVVTTAESARVVTRMRSGGFTIVDFREAKGLSRRTHQEIDRKIDVIRREAEARSFRQALRAADRGPRTRVAQIGGFETLAPPIEVEPSFATVRVVVPSPFKL